MTLDGVPVLKEVGAGVYLVDNSVLGADFAGLAWRRSKSINDKDRDALSEWGTSVSGSVESGEWLKIMVPKGGIDAVRCPDCSVQMRWSDYAEGPYASGWRCDNFNNCGHRWSDSGRHRWFCATCQKDFCASCGSFQAAPVARRPSSTSWGGR